MPLPNQGPDLVGKVADGVDIRQIIHLSHEQDVLSKLGNLRLWLEWAITPVGPNADHFYFVAAIPGSRQLLLFFGAYDDRTSGPAHELLFAPGQVTRLPAVQQARGIG